ncbi:MAG: hypothetical protein ABWY06_08820 [Pseudomonas sp.]|uniref:hypothetical protein n=1 Tax=Pseudomonas sp. TaxID=306 RepID=UPI0033991830
MQHSNSNQVGQEARHVGESEAAMSGAIPWPVSAISVSGVYKLSDDQKVPFVPLVEPSVQSAQNHDPEQEYTEPDLYDAGTEAIFAGIQTEEELRLDVDGPYPQMTASGTITRALFGHTHWIAKLKRSGRFSWSGHIWFKEGDQASLPQTNVQITVSSSLHNHQRRITAKFTGGGAPARIRAFRFFSAYYQAVEFEFDREQGITAVSAIDTDAHPNRPASIPIESLSIDTVFRRAGFNTTRLAGNDILPGEAGGNSTWSDMEMHNAMQAHWSRFTDKPQWSLWTFFANQHDAGSSLGGIMFDDIGPNHRQGTALFYNSFISQAPAADAAPGAWVNRMRFWTAVHEMGHAFNLAHSWQKALVFNGKGPWVPLPNEPEARSFMNYPYSVAGGQTAFFANFEFRFSDSELLFLRHAPRQFVQMGNADWFDHHGFQQARVSAEPSLRLEIRVNRELPRFEFLEPVMLEMKLTNVTEQPMLLPDDLLSDTEAMTIIIKRQGHVARERLSYAHYCRKPGQAVLRSGESLYQSLFVAAGRGGWQIAEPGDYLVQMCLHRNDQDIVSNALTVRVQPPQSRREEFLAQDFFEDDVGRVLTFDGGNYSRQVNHTLREVIDQLPNRRVSDHAKIALSMPKLFDVKSLEFSEDGCYISVQQADRESARDELAQLLGDQGSSTAETLGHIDYAQYVGRFCDALGTEGDQRAVAQVKDTLRQAAEVLSARHVIRSVTQHFEERRAQLDKKGGKGRAA